jgi:hypothetical protein
MRSLIVLLILGTGADALAQSTRPATRPASAGVRRVATLREGAPASVREWWARQPEFKADALARMRDDANDLRAHADRLAEANKALARSGVAARRVPDGTGRLASETDTAAVAARRRELADNAKTIGDLRKRAKEMDAATKAFETRADFVAIPPLDNLSVGASGIPSRIYRMKVREVVDGSTVAVRMLRPGDEEHEGTLVWIRGLSTAKLHDDSGFISYEKPLLVTGTTQYGTALGGRRTVLVLEPIDLETWVEYVEEPPRDEVSDGTARTR